MSVRAGRLTGQAAKAAATCLAIVASGLAAFPAAAVAQARPSSAKTLQVGTLLLHRCGVANTWCGSLPVPFDRSDASAGTIDIGFLWFPATDSGPILGTIVAEEGGPGFPSTGTQSQYIPLYQPLLNHRNLLLVDDRGTGLSGAITCPSLQNFHGIGPSPAFLSAVRECGDRLDHRWRRADGSWVHAADLFGTANAARDLVAVLTALETGPVDLYGDSYGTWFSQTFASRYPSMLRSVTLDASYQVLDLLPWYITTVTTARYAFNASCQRSIACSTAAAGSSWSRIGQLAERLRSAPLQGETVGNNNRRQQVVVDLRALVNLVNDAGIDAGVYRELDGAARALLEHNDSVPLLRLTAQTLAFDNGSSGNASQFSEGLYFAVACTDYPQLFDMHAAVAVRTQQLAASVSRLPAATFAPFTTAEWIKVDAYDEAYTACLDWPAPVHNDPPIVRTPPLMPASIPVLVLGGDLDSLTPETDGGRLVARQMGPSARFVNVPNTVHVTALLDPYNCASVLVRDFTVDPGHLFSMDTSCTASIPEVRVVGAFPSRLSGETPATPAPGNGADDTGLRCATVATETLGDAMARLQYVNGPDGTGLRGGTFAARVTGRTESIRLNDSRWVEDAAVSGSATWDTSGAVNATMTIVDSRGDTGSFTIRWNTLLPRAVAVITGSFAGHALAATVPAP